jgi:hypothetical protein
MRIFRANHKKNTAATAELYYFRQKNMENDPLQSRDIEIMPGFGI